GGVVLEGLLLQGFLGVGESLGLGIQRVAAMAAMLLFALILLLLEYPLAAGLLRAGRRLELRLRIAFLAKLPRLCDRYFQRRRAADMAARGHNAHILRGLPIIAGQFLRASFTLLAVTTGIIWLDPAVAPQALSAAIASIAIPLAFGATLAERDLRMRTHQGALSRFYLDALLGLVAIRAHGASGVVRREHEGLLVRWLRAGWALQ